MINFLKKIFPSKNDRVVRGLYKTVAEINKAEEKLQSLSEPQLQAKTAEFKERFNKGESLDSLMVEAYAVVKNACRRLKGTTAQVTEHELVWDMVPYDVQLMGGVVINSCGIAEMATGEGKTLMATLPLYLNALSGRNCQLITVNDYLALRDSQWMGHLFTYLGLTVGCLQTTLRDPAQRRAQYACDITYGTNSEFGFDYLRDMGMAMDRKELVQRDHFFAIIDEVDSILIDEARTPLIISGPAAVSTHRYDILKPSVERVYRKQAQMCNDMVNEAKEALAAHVEGDDRQLAVRKLVKAKLGMPKHKLLMRLMEDPDIRRAMDKDEGFIRSQNNKGLFEEVKEELYFTIDERNQDVDLSEKGRDLLDPQDSEAFVLPDLTDLFSQIDTDEALDEEQKIEHKQQIQSSFDVKSESIHNISQLLKAYCVFEKDVQYVVADGKVVIVDEYTGRLMEGRRYSDGLHQAIEAKENVKIERETQTLASITIQNYFRLYEKLAGMTGTAETEATEFKEIYKLDVVTIPTNRPCIRKDLNDQVYKTRREKFTALINEVKEKHAKGQPILVGTASVDISELISRMLKIEKIPHNVLNAKNHAAEAEIVARAGQKGAITIATNMAGRGTDIKLGEGVRELGGLHVIGSERHDSRRVDRQLRGRCSRQGDPGSSVFFVSLEDDLMRLFMSERMVKLMETMGMKEGEVLEAPMLSHSIQTAQRRVEQQHFAVRKRTLEYDDVMNQQRQVIYGLRKDVLMAEDMRGFLMDIVELALDDSFDKFKPERVGEGQLDREAYMNWLRSVFPIKFPDDILGEGKTFDREAVRKGLMKHIDHAYSIKESKENPDALRWLEQQIILSAVDENYKVHLYEMDALRTSIGLKAYAQRDPLVEYKQEAYKLFQGLMDKISFAILGRMFRSSTSYEAMVNFLQMPDIVEQHLQLDGFDRPVNPVEEAPEAPLQEMSVSYSHSGEEEPEDEENHERVLAPPEPVLPQRRVHPKVGRNEPCPCGSGKKFKQCCGR